MLGTTGGRFMGPSGSSQLQLHRNPLWPPLTAAAAGRSLEFQTNGEGQLLFCFSFVGLFYVFHYFFFYYYYYLHNYTIIYTIPILYYIQNLNFRAFNKLKLLVSHYLYNTLIKSNLIKNAWCELWIHILLCLWWYFLSFLSNLNQKKLSLLMRWWWVWLQWNGMWMGWPGAHETIPFIVNNRNPLAFHNSALNAWRSKLHEMQHEIHTHTLHSLTWIRCECLNRTALSVQEWRWIDFDFNGLNQK